MFKTCSACETRPESFRCPVCKKTGPEIYRARVADKIKKVQ